MLLLWPGPRWVRISLIAVTILLFGLVCFFNALASSQLGRDAGIYRNSTSDISAAYDTPLTPSGWTFSIWGVIYTWQALWLAYSVSTIFREGVQGQLVSSPNYLPPAIYLFYSINMIANIVWLILWDQANMVGALVDIFFMAVPLYVSLAVSALALERERGSLVENGFQLEVVLVRAFVHNGLAIYITWLFVAMLINFTIVLHYVAGSSMYVAASLSQTLLTVGLVAWYILDVHVFDAYTRFIFTPYVTLVFALSGVIDKNPVANDSTGSYSAVLLGASLGFGLVKVGMTVYRSWRDRHNLLDPESVGNFVRFDSKQKKDGGL